MNKKLQKITLLVASLAILAACIFTVSALATGAEFSAEPTLEISKRNLIYYDDIAIMFATKAENVGENPDLKLKCYVNTDEGEKIVYISDYKEDSTIDTGVTYYVFETPGISLAHLSDEVVVQLVATVDGVEYFSELSRFSVVEYNYKRLYYDACGYDAAAPKVNDYQAALYSNVIGMGTNLQITAGVNTTDTPALYYYVNAKGADVETVSRDGYTATLDTATMKAGESFTLKYGGELSAGQYVEWTVDYTQNDGTKTTETVADGTVITIEDKHIVAVPEVKTVSVTFDDGIGEGVTASVSDSTLLSAGIVDSPEPQYDGDKAYKVLAALPSTTSNAGKTAVGTTTIDLMGDSGSCYIFSADLYYTNESSRSSNFMMFYFKNTSGETVQQTTWYYGTTPGAYIRMMAGKKGNGAYDYFGGFNTANEWVNITIELYYANSTWQARYFLDGIFIFEDTAYMTTSATPVGSVVFEHLDNDVTAYWDNISFIRTDKVYSDTFETGSPVLTGTHTGGTYYNNSTLSGTRVNFDQIIDGTSGNGRSSVLNDTGPVVNGTTSGINAFNANGFAYAYKTGACSGSGTIQYNVNAPTATVNKSVVELDMAVGTPSSDYPIVLTTRLNGYKADFYIVPGSTDGTMKFSNMDSIVDEKSVEFNENEWINVRLVIKKDTWAATNTEQNKGYILADLYINGELVGVIQGVDSTADTSNNNVMIQLRPAEETVTFCYDNVYIGYEE